MHFQREFAEGGGLISYWTDQADANRQGGIYAGRILNGEKPGVLLGSCATGHPTRQGYAH
jgi:putative ABC transport system substrate-binding protein